mmetsp:Transcript_2040/g.2556  ORF Transcript_2040/g.2556 Transcript_2040/m.2556 type:complete len:245 (-) Transcript_2040:122-856(-)
MAKKITLKQLVCINCNKPMTHPRAKELFEPINKLYKKFEDAIMAKLKVDKKLNDPQIKNKNGQFYNDPIGFGNKIYSFYICHECGDPFYGGLNECIVGLNEDDFDPKERLCVGCDKPDKVCKKHGKMFIKRKCRFCCSPGTFLCGGTTSYCEECHKFGANSFYQFWTKGGKFKDFKKTDHLLPLKNGKPHPWKCGDQDDPCPLGKNFKHPPHGEEFVIGCALCHTEYVNRVTAQWFKVVDLKSI